MNSKAAQFRENGTDIVRLFTWRSPSTDTAVPAADPSLASGEDCSMLGRAHGRAIPAERVKSRRRARGI
jgi:hypothetical protein